GLLDGLGLWTGLAVTGGLMVQLDLVVTPADAGGPDSRVKLGDLRLGDHWLGRLLWLRGRLRLGLWRRFEFGHRLFQRRLQLRLRRWRSQRLAARRTTLRPHLGHVPGLGDLLGLQLLHGVRDAV